MSGRRKKGYFSISAVAQMLSIHQQTIRMYEREGLISPKRSEGNTRLFSEEDIQKLEEVIYLTHTAGVNLAGVHIIMKLQKRLDKLQKEVSGLFTSLHYELDQEVQEVNRDIKEHMTRLARLAQPHSKSREAVRISGPTSLHAKDSPPEPTDDNA
jgi:MerR family transcriptional regulator, heat shock protein HspR